MKLVASLFVVICLLHCTPALAGFMTCAKSVGENPKQRRAVEFLRPLVGQYSLGKCAVELHVCDSFAEDDSPGTVVGDVQITDSKGHVSYIELNFLNLATSTTYAKIQNGSIMFHYEFYDRTKDPEFGRTESVRIEFLKSRDLTRLTSIEAGVYSTKAWLERGKKFTTYWSICHGSESLPISADLDAVPLEGMK